MFVSINVTLVYIACHLYVPTARGNNETVLSCCSLLRRIFPCIFFLVFIQYMYAPFSAFTFYATQSARAPHASDQS